MKHLRLNTLFHWLYAFLMLMPVIKWFGGLLANFATGGGVGLPSYQDFSFPSLGGVYDTIRNVYGSLFADVLGISVSGNAEVIYYALSYWTIVSMIYLIFDVLMIPVNLCHRLIDEGGF